jgi:hypothetical protein
VSKKPSPSLCGTTSPARRQLATLTDILASDPTTAAAPRASGVAATSGFRTARRRSRTRWLAIAERRGVWTYILPMGNNGFQAT